MGMNDLEKAVQKQLDIYSVDPADESNILATTALGKQRLTQSPSQNLSWWHLLMQQMRYISVWLWIAQLLVLGVSLVIIRQWNSVADITVVLSSISLLFVLLGVIAFPELCKAYTYQMWELEQSCKYNLQQITALKLTIIGGIDLLIILVVSFFTSQQTALALWQVALYLMVPFNMSCSLGFYIIKYSRHTFSASAVLAAGFGFGFLSLIVINRFSVYHHFSWLVWLLLLGGSSMLLFIEAKRFLQLMAAGEVNYAAGTR